MISAPQDNSEGFAITHDMRQNQVKLNRITKKHVVSLLAKEKDSRERPMPCMRKFGIVVLRRSESKKWLSKI
eukprot:12183443-Heterocapsa_arctica.AAC.1